MIYYFFLYKLYLFALIQSFDMNDADDTFIASADRD